VRDEGWDAAIIALTALTGSELDRKNYFGARGDCGKFRTSFLSKSFAETHYLISVHFLQISVRPMCS
jgi:hypothetical protein